MTHSETLLRTAVDAGRIGPIGEKQIIRISAIFEAERIRMILTPRQLSALRFIGDRRQEGQMPTTRELAKHLGVSQPGAVNILRKLEAEGLITREKYESRAIKLI